MTEQELNQTKSFKKNLKEIIEITAILKKYGKEYSNEELQLIALQLLEASSGLECEGFVGSEENSRENPTEAIKDTPRSSGSLKVLKSQHKKGTNQ